MHCEYQIDDGLVVAVFLRILQVCVRSNQGDGHHHNFATQTEMFLTEKQKEFFYTYNSTLITVNLDHQAKRTATESFSNQTFKKISITEI